MFVPYCSKDLHIGASETNNYHGNGSNAELEVQHKGYNNGASVLEWVTQYFPSPDAVIVTGCGEGAIGNFPDLH